MADGAVIEGLLTATGWTLALAIFRTELDTWRPGTALRLTVALAADFWALDTTTFLAITSHLHSSVTTETTAGLALRTRRSRASDRAEVRHFAACDCQ